jgi:hypothetical protein
MDEAAGCLGPIVAVIVVVALVLAVLGWLFLALAHLFGHALILVLMLTGIGAVGGLVRHDRRNPAAEAVSDEDYAEVAGIRLLPAEWAMRIAVSFVIVVALFGLVIV